MAERRREINSMLNEFEKQIKDTDTQRFHFMQVAELLKEPRPINWLIKDRVEAGSLSLTFGEPGSMKTFEKLDEGLCISSGKNWHGHKTTRPTAGTPTSAAFDE